MIENLKHIQLPTNMTEFIIKPKDAVVYLFMRRYENWETHETFVSIAVVAERLHMGRRSVMESIERLERAGYITITKGQSNRNVYHFNEYKTFEGFSDEFLDNPNLSIEEKGYLAMIQKFMYLDSQNENGTITMSEKELADRLGLSKRQITNYNQSLKSKGFLSCQQSRLPDYIENDGNKKPIRVYDIKAYGQAIVFLLKKHHEQIQKNTEDIEELKQQIDHMKKQHEQTNKDLIDKINQLIEENSLLRKVINKDYLNEPYKKYNYNAVLDTRPISL